jgi:hypothetical protein
MMVVALLSRANDRAEPGLREGQLSRDANQWRPDKHPKLGLLLHHPLPTIGASGHATSRGPVYRARTNRAKKVPLVLTRGRSIRASVLKLSR